MFTTRRAIVATALSLGGTVVAAPTAFATRLHDPSGGPTSIPHTASYGSPIWVFVLVAVLGMLVTVAITLTAIRLRPAKNLAAVDHIDLVGPERAVPFRHQAPQASVDS